MDHGDGWTILLMSANHDHVITLVDGVEISRFRPSRGGEVMIRMLEDVKQATIGPLIERTIAEGTLIYTDECDIYSRLAEWGYGHETVCHAEGVYARDDDGDGFCEVHVNTLEGFWSLLRSWLRPHRGISQESLPLLRVRPITSEAEARGCWGP